jgi:RNA polymerase sigma factor (sigma-70 family)
MQTINTTRTRQNQLSDENLVRACRLGEAEAWSALVQRYQRLIYTIPLRAGLDEDQAAEVFQRTFARLLEHLDRIEQPGRIRAWLVTTARREAWRLIREQTAEQPLPDADDPLGEFSDESLPDGAPLLDEALLRLEEQHLIRQAIGALDERCRQLLNLLFYRPDTPSYAEVAIALGIPEGSLGPTRARCLRKLRHQLEESGY